MEGKPVRRSNGLAVASFCLGLVGFLTSGLFLYPLVHGSDLFGSLVHKIYIGSCTALSSGCGLVGLIAGIVFLTTAGRKSKLATAGIILSILAILGGYPFMLLIAWLVRV